MPRLVALAAFALFPFACKGSVQNVALHDATPQAAPAPAAPELGPAVIDAALRAEWAKAGVTPTPLVDDARFVRRLYLDVVGTVPPPEAVTAFVSDASPGKTAKLVDALLASPAYAAYWSAAWEETLVGWQAKDGLVDRGALRTWLEAKFATNEPWDRIATELLTATGRSSLGGRRVDSIADAFPDAAPSMLPPLSPPPLSPPPAADAAPPVPDGAPVNGAVNWFLRYRDAPLDMAGNASRIFLGVQIQCAQCHDHKTEKWKQSDFRRFAACFDQTRAEVVDKAGMGIRRADVSDVGRPLPRWLKNPDVEPVTVMRPTALDGTDLGAVPDVRKALAAWVTSEDNPWFAKAFVNRMWGHFLGKGFTDPIDDIRPSNPADAPELWDALSRDFEERGYDVKALIKTIALTTAYHLAPLPASAPASAGRDDGALWNRFHVTPLDPDELIRSILDATGVEGALVHAKQANLERIRFQLYQRYTFLFDVDEDVEQTDFEGTVAQALALLNGALVGGGISAIPGGALDAVLREPGSDQDHVTALYRRTIARDPSQGELAYWVHAVTSPSEADVVSPPPPPPPPPPAEAAKKKNGKPAKQGKRGPDAFTRIEERGARQRMDPRRRAYEDLFWALLNSSEFALNH